MSRYSLFIDDERFPPRNDGRHWVVARDWEDVMMSLRIHGMPGYISFDHDLGEDTHTGYDIAKFLVELDMNGDPDFALPAEFDFYVHSQNPIGKANIEHYLNNYLKVRNQSKQSAFPDDNLLNEDPVELSATLKAIVDNNLRKI